MPERGLHSHAMRQISPEADGLRLGCGWHPRDLDKPWIVVETPAGDSHPCASGLEELRSHVRDGILESVRRYPPGHPCYGPLPRLP